jgi:hypothetical protein
MTDIEAANKALALLGVAPVVALTADTQAARTMNRLIEPAKRAVLSEFAWSFALRLARLSASAAEPPDGWKFSFAYPSGAAALYRVYYAEDGEFMKIPFIVQNGVINTNRRPAAAEYTALDLALPAWSDSAAEALTARLASDAAVTLTGSQQMSVSLLEKYSLLINIARANSVHTEYGRQPRPTHYIDVREEMS